MEDTEKSEFRVLRIIGIFLLFILFIYFVGMNLPNWMAYWRHGPCWDVMEDASNIATAIDNYFAGHGYSSITQSEVEKLVKKPIANPWTITKKGNEYFIQITDSSGKCHTTFQERYPEWDSGVYTYQVNLD